MSKSPYAILRGPDQQFAAQPQPTFFEQRWQAWLDQQDVSAEHKVYIRLASRKAFAAGWNAALDELGANDAEGREVSP